MAAHVTLPGRHRRTRDRASGRTRGRGWIVPAVLGVIYGFYAQFVERDGEGPVTGGQALLGVVSAVVFGGLCYLVGRTRQALPRELRATAFGSVAGLGIGFLYSLTGASVLTSTVMGLIVGAGVGLGAFYVFYTHE